MDQKLTPMMEQYRSIKKTLPEDTILFFRLGDFYEMFFQDAVRASEILNITLTGREGGAAGRVPMCGIPYHSFQPYIRSLLDRNLKVAICEQIGDPQAATPPPDFFAGGKAAPPGPIPPSLESGIKSGGGAKGLVERKITRIITPATFLDDESGPIQPEYLAAVAADRTSCAVAALDLGTGEFRVREVPLEGLAHELALLSPRELILPKCLSQKVKPAADSMGASVTLYEDWIFQPQEVLPLLKERFHLASERGLGLQDRPLAVGASGALLYYLRDHLHAALEHLRPPSFLKEEEFMSLDRQTIRSLELVSGLSGLGKVGSLLGCLDSTLTPMGGRTLYHWITHPLLFRAAIEERQEAVAELAGDAAGLQNLRSLLKGIKDVERTLSRLNVGVANAADLLHLKLFLERGVPLKQALESGRSRILQDLAGELNPEPELAEQIGRTIVDQPPSSLREGGLIRDGCSAGLDELRRLASQGKSWLVEFQRREIDRTGIKSLRIKYSQVFGYAIEVSKPNLHRVPSDYLRKQTLINAERFIVPELKAWDEKISGAQEKIRALEYQLFQEIRGKTLERLACLQGMARGLGTLDALAGLAWTALQKGWVRPKLTDSLELKIEGGRHPVVEMMLPAGQFVENDTILDGQANQLIVLTGPNMAGKSTAIRQVAQIVLLAQIGSFVPARRATIGLVDRIFTRIGASDDLARGESTFMVEMVEMAQILRTATDRSLLILDEVGRGTSTFDGVSLAWAICEYLAAGPVKPRTLFATHYHELIQLEEQFPNVKNFTITVRETSERILFLRKVIRGGSDRSYGIHVAQLAGIPREVTERAQKILRVLESENAEATRLIEIQ